MNAISRVFDPMPAEKPSSVVVVAAYLRALAREGKGCATNNKTIAMRLGLSTSQVRAAKGVLVRERRLIGAYQIWVSIDGEMFSRGREIDEVEAVKAILRRRYGVVYDPRTIADPEHIAKGVPKELNVAGRVIPWRECVALSRVAAAQLAATVRHVL